MTVADYIILVQNLLLIFIITCSSVILCKGKKKAPPNKMGSNGSNETAQKSGIKSPDTGGNAASQTNGVKDEGKKDGDGATIESKEGDKKDGEKKDGDKKDDQSKETPQKPFPKFEMPTESKKNRKMQENEFDKKEKIKKGFYQQKSDEDDTLEKVDSLHVEQSDKTKRSQKKKNKK